MTEAGCGSKSLYQGSDVVCRNPDFHAQFGVAEPRWNTPLVRRRDEADSAKLVQSGKMREVTFRCAVTGVRQDPRAADPDPRPRLAADRRAARRLLDATAS